MCRVMPLNLYQEEQPNPTECLLKRPREQSKEEITHIVPDYEVCELPPRKRVRFCTEVQQQSPPSPASGEEERPKTWYGRSELRTFMQDCATTVRECNDSNYLSLLACTYINCYNNESQSSSSLKSLSELSSQKLAVSSLNDSDDCCARGLERLTSPQFVGSPTRKRRKEAINLVLRSYKILNSTNGCSDNTKSEMLRKVSERHSEPAKKFAKAMAFVDTMSAWVEYGGDIPQNI